MNYIVLDLEFNQAFDFKRGRKTKKDKLCPFEIIQIGAVKLDNELNKIDEFSANINPTLYTRIHPFVGKITSLTMEDLIDSDGFIDVYERFADFASNDSIFCCWGDNDMPMLYRNLLRHKIDLNTISGEFLNVQAVTSVYLERPKAMRIGLENAVEMLELPCELSFHDALNDARYTAQILQKIGKEVDIVKEIKTFNPKKIIRKNKKELNEIYKEPFVYEKQKAN